MLKTQCYFKLAEYVNSWKIIISVKDEEYNEKLIEKLDVIVEMWLDKDTKISIIKKDDIIKKLWRSPDYADMLMMRMFYELYKLSPIEGWEQVNIEFNPYNKTVSNEEKTLDEIIFADDEEVELEFEDNVYN